MKRAPERASKTNGRAPILSLSAKIISQSSRKNPADSVLRHELKASRGLSRERGADVSRGVFSYFRWHRWLDARQDIPEQVRQALEFADMFKADQQFVSDAELLERSVPDWVRGEMQVSAAWARAIQAEPRLWLRAKKGLGAEVSRRLGDCRQFSSEMPDTLEYLGGKDLFRTPEFQAGMFEVQDLASQAVSLICDPRPGETWWDACAGEGGKLLHLSDLMENRGLIWATDRAEWRLKKSQQRAARARAFNYRARLWDGGPKLPMKTLFDGVLVDAPCSGIGTWQRNPHARWTTTPEDVRELGAAQKNLLHSVAAAVKPGGKLVYSVCTLAHAETTDVAAEFERQHPEFRPLALTNPLERRTPSTPQLWLRTEDTGGNGMFIAGWERTKSE